MIQFKESFKKVNDTKKGYHKFFLSDFFFPNAIQLKKDMPMTFILIDPKSATTTFSNLLTTG